MRKFFTGLLVVGAVIFAFVKWASTIVAVLGSIVSFIIYIVFVRGGDI